jgi:hypothetical protein
MVSAEDLFVCSELQGYNECCEQVEGILTTTVIVLSDTKRKQECKATDLEVRSPALCRLHHM